MGQPAKKGVEIADFPGLIIDADPNDLPVGGAVDQVNVQSSRPGQLMVRAGWLEVTFET